MKALPKCFAFLILFHWVLFAAQAQDCRSHLDNVEIDRTEVIGASVNSVVTFTVRSSNPCFPETLVGLSVTYSSPTSLPGFNRSTSFLADNGSVFTFVAPAVASPIPVTVNISASFGGPLTHSFTVLPFNPSLSLAPDSLAGGNGQTALGVLVFDAPVQGTVIRLMVDPPSDVISLRPLTLTPELGLCVPSFCPFGLGKDTFQFEIATTRTVTTNLTLVITATVSGLVQRSATFTVESEQTALRIRAGIGTGPLEPAQGVVASQTAPASAYFPLGSSFRIAAFDENGNPVSATFSLQAATVEAGVEPGALFPNLVALKYTNAPPNEATFQAVHRGTVPLQIVPTDPNIEPALLNIVVENPQSLGTANPQFDSIIQDLAHSRGVLPQYIKAIAHHESAGTFNGLSYRYEPIGPNVGDLDVISHGLDFRLQPPYRDYRIATADYYGPSDPPLPQGPDILPDDVNPRSIYFITRPDCQIPGSTLIVRRPIRPCDQFVGADEIYFDNRGQNWARLGRRAPQVQANPTLLSFTAQTGLASSYGLMQVMYVTAVDDLQWLGITGSAQFRAGLKNPSFLFDTPANHQAGGGSLRLGTDYIASKMRLRAGLSALANESGLRASFSKALQSYNARGTYPSQVLQFVDPYQPVPARPVL